MISWRSHGLLAALFTLMLLPSLAAAESSRCSIAPFPSDRDPQATYLLGIATPDTLLAGPGSVEPSPGPGHWGAADTRPIYGQRIEVERFGGADGIAVADAFEQQGASSVVIVPWDYDPACRTAVWSRSAGWVPLGEPGVYTVRLRPTSQWAEGLPTFDAFMADSLVLDGQRISKETLACSR